MPRRFKQNALRARRIAMGLCSLCERPLKTLTYCEACIEHIKWLKKRKKKMPLVNVRWNEDPVGALRSDLAWESRKELLFS